MKKTFLSTVVIFFALTDLFAQSDICVDFVPAKDSKTKFLLKCISTGNLTISEIKSPNDSLPIFQSMRLKSNPMLIVYHKNGETYSSILYNELKEYKIKVIGKEKVNNYDCIKLSVTTLDNGSCSSYIWVTNKVTDLKKLIDLNIHGLNIAKLYLAMDMLNIQGFPVRVEFVGDYTQTYDLNEIKFGGFSKSFAKFKPKEPRLDSLKRVGKISEQEYLDIKKAEDDAKTAAENAAKRHAADEAEKKSKQPK